MLLLFIIHRNKGDLENLIYLSDYLQKSNNQTIAGRYIKRGNLN